MFSYYTKYFIIHPGQVLMKIEKICLLVDIFALYECNLAQFPVFDGIWEYV